MGNINIRKAAGSYMAGSSLQKVKVWWYVSVLSGIRCLERKKLFIEDIVMAEQLRSKGIDCLLMQQ